MFQQLSDSEIDLQQMIRAVARMNPHVAVADIAWLVGVPYEPQAGEQEYLLSAALRD